MALELFPSGALNSSVITTVWLGVAVVCMFNLRFGTTMSGLVVPGYLVPLLLARPMSAFVIVAEGMVSYLLTLLLIDKFFQRVGSSEMFGRDRFFALVLVSVLVRITADGWLLPELGLWLTSIGYVFDYQANLHSFGLVIVALVANQMWNGGIRFGLPTLVLYTGVTYLLVRFGLMEFTNFSLSNLAFMYEDIAADILASPKAYIILLTTGYVASRMNLQYGWEFSGILIPALLALQWYQPMKLVATFFEALVILLGVRLLLKLPLLARMNMEGARLLLLFFNVAFVYKILLGFALPWVVPGAKVSDYYAFGYLLSTLMAMKMYQKDITLRMSRAIVQISLIGVAAASVFGFALTRLLPGGLPVLAPTGVIVEAGVIRQTTDIMQRVSKARAALYASQPGGGIAPLPGQISSFDNAMGLLREFRQARNQEAGLASSRESSRDSGQERGERRSQQLLGRAAAQLNQLGFDVEQVDDRYLLLIDKQPERGWGIYLLDLQADKELLVEVPATLNERGTTESALALFVDQGYSGLALAGTRRETQNTGENTRSPAALFQRFHQAFGGSGALQLRGTARQLDSGVAAEMWIKRRAPDDLVLAELEDLIGNIQVTWGERPYPNRQREVMHDRFAEIILNRQTIRRLLGRTALAVDLNEREADTRIDGYLYRWLLGSKTQLAARDSDLYQPPTLGELLFLESEVLNPLLALIADEQASRVEHNDEASRQELLEIAAAAGVVGLELVRYRQRNSDREYLILAEPRDPGPIRFWGTYVFRLGQSTDYIVEVPRPLAELRSFEYGTTLFERLNASVLLIAGAHPASNPDGSADVLNGANKLSLFNQVHQSLLRGVDRSSQLVLQIRAYNPPADQVAEADIILAFWEGRAVAPVDGLVDELQRELVSDGSSLIVAGGGEQTRGYDVRANAQTSFLRFVERADLGVLWLSSSLRRGFRQPEASVAELNKFNAIGVVSSDGDLLSSLAGERWSERLDSERRNSERAGADTDWAGISAALDDYLATRDIVRLHQAQQLDGGRWQRLLDGSSGQAFLLSREPSGALRWVCNLQPVSSKDSLIRSDAVEPDQLERYRGQRQRCLRRGEPS